MTDEKRVWPWPGWHHGPSTPAPEVSAPPTHFDDVEPSEGVVGHKKVRREDGVAVCVWCGLEDNFWRGNNPGPVFPRFTRGGAPAGDRDERDPGCDRRLVKKKEEAKR